MKLSNKQKEKLSKIGSDIQYQTLEEIDKTFERFGRQLSFVKHKVIVLKKKRKVQEEVKILQQQRKKKQRIKRKNTRYHSVRSPIKRKLTRQETKFIKYPEEQVKSSKKNRGWWKNMPSPRRKSPKRNLISHRPKVAKKKFQSRQLTYLISPQTTRPTTAALTTSIKFSTRPSTGKQKASFQKNSLVAKSMVWVKLKKKLKKAVKKISSSQIQCQRYTASMLNKNCKLSSKYEEYQQRRLVMNTYQHICFKREKELVTQNLPFVLLRAKTKLMRRIKRKKMLKSAKTLLKLDVECESLELVKLSPRKSLHGKFLQTEEEQEKEDKQTRVKRNGEHVLFKAAQQNNFNMLKNISIAITPQECNMRDTEGNTVLYYAISRNNPKIVRFVLQRGGDPNMVAEKETGNTAVHLAFKKDSLQIIIACLQYGADLHKTNTDEHSPIYYAKEQTLEHIQRLINKAFIRSPSRKEFYDLLQEESQSKKKKKFRVRRRPATLLAKFLYEQEVGVKVRNGQEFIDREEFLFEAARKNNFHLILNSEFVFKKENCLKVDYYGRSAICYALHHDNIQFTKFLLSHGTNVNKVCDMETGDTAVHMSFRRDKLMIILLVLTKSADLNLLNNDQLTPIDLANKKTLEYLNLDSSVSKASSMNLSKYDFQLKMKKKPERRKYGFV